MRLRALLAFGCLAISPAAFSQQPYVSANLGWASADFPLRVPFGGAVDDSAETYGIDFGVGFGERWGFELGWNGYGDFSGSAAACAAGVPCSPAVAEGSVDESVSEASLVRHFNVRNMWLYGKAGYYRAKIDTTLPFPDTDFSESGLVLGVGLRWYFAAPWGLSFEATRFDDNVSQLSVGFGWGLGFDNENSTERRSRRTDAADHRL
jgi:hypothetical protein